MWMKLLSSSGVSVRHGARVSVLAEGLARLPLPPTKRWHDGVRDVELARLDTASLSVFAPAPVDYQAPHSTDEVYVVASGRAEFVTPEGRQRVGVSDAITVPAECPHHFEAMSSDFATWVVFVELPDDQPSMFAAVRRAEAFVDAWLAGDLEMLSAFLAPDCRYSNSVSIGSGQEVVGRDDVLAAFAEILHEADDRTRFGPIHAASPTVAVIEWSVYTDDGYTVSARGCDVVEFDDGLIVRKDVFRKAANDIT
jgi:mannose-6-phosphate isomerase-like protein (cupin superfamily)